MYVESCNKIFTSTYKNRIIMLIFTIYLTYPLLKCVSFLTNEVDDTVPKEPTIDMLLKTI